MKLKCRPDEFRVEEVAKLPTGAGPFALYRLTKRSLGTPEAIGAICEAWKIARNDIGFGGLKDRHAVTRQFITIRNGPPRDLTQTNLELEYLAQSARPFDSKDIQANRFDVILRDLRTEEVDRIAAALPIVAQRGIPNYFDDQRFGSVGVSGDFIARAWCLGDYERALWLALAEANEHDRLAIRAEKRHLRERWGNWAACRREAVRPVTRAAIDRLGRNPRDFRSAFVCIPQHERRMYLGAFQSFLWNRVLAESIRAACDPTALFEVEIGRTRLPFYQVSSSGPPREVGEWTLPLPSARGRSELGPMTELYERVAGEFGLECRQLRVKYPRDSFFSRGSRMAAFRPRSISWTVSDDESDPNRRRTAGRRLLLRFELPPGSYATILVKLLTEMP